MIMTDHVDREGGNGSALPRHVVKTDLLPKFCFPVVSQIRMSKDILKKLRGVTVKVPLDPCLPKIVRFLWFLLQFLNILG